MTNKKTNVTLFSEKKNREVIYENYQLVTQYYLLSCRYMKSRKEDREVDWKRKAEWCRTVGPFSKIFATGDQIQIAGPQMDHIATADAKVIDGILRMN